MFDLSLDMKPALRSVLSSTLVVPQIVSDAVRKIVNVMKENI